LALTNILHSSNSQSWYTPSRYIEAAREVFGGVIELDPASCEQANKTVNAKRYFNETSDGLSRPWWADSVFANPPYGKTDGKSNQEVWSTKMIYEYNMAHFSQGILLINATTDRKWFQALWKYPICFTNHRIRFYSPEGVGNAPTHGNAFVYFGPNKEKFTTVFRAFGMVVTAN
jgi:hypothetical protein